MTDRGSRGTRRWLVVPAVCSLVVITLAPPSLGRPAPRVDRAPPATTQADFNGDGFADLAVASLLEDVGPAEDAGGVAVLYGAPAGLQARSPDDQFWTQDSPGVQDSAEPNDRFGETLATGDFNGDGFTDLAIGVPNEDFPALTDPGAVAVVYGSSVGLQADGVGGPDDQLWTQDSPGLADTAEAGDRFGAALATGDLNGDGFSDLAVGVSEEDLRLVKDAGAVEVMYGSSSGLQASEPGDQFWTRGSPGVKGSIRVEVGFGFSLTTGDLNGDGFDDLAISGGRTPVSVLFGSVAGLQADAPDDQLWNQNAPGVRQTNNSGDSYGFAMGSADFNGDGFEDLAAGVPGEQKRNGVIRSGAVSILYGSAQGLQAFDPDDQLFAQNMPGVAGTAQESDQMGSSVAVGDFNGDGFADLLAGSGYDRFTIGGVNAFYGSASGLVLVDPDNQLWSQNAPLVRDVGEGYEYFALSVTAADFNQDGYEDLAAGVEGETILLQGLCGAVSVIYGTNAGLQAVDPDDQLWYQGSHGLGDAFEDGDLFGATVEAGG